MPPSTVPFSRRPSDGPRGGRLILLVILIAAAAATLLALAYLSFPSASRATTASSMAVAPTDDGCCRGLEGLELWGPAVKWGSDHHLPSAAACCESCKAMCKAADHVHGDDDCRCDSWVFCGDKKRCGQRFGECWLKKQKDVMAPSVVAKGDDVMWTSGLVFAKGEGIVGLETNLGTIRIQGFYRILFVPICSTENMVYAC